LKLKIRLAISVRGAALAGELRKMKICPLFGQDELSCFCQSKLIDITPVLYFNQLGISKQCFARNCFDLFGRYLLLVCLSARGMGITDSHVQSPFT
jgi:hypothetical protein